MALASVAHLVGVSSRMKGSRINSGQGTCLGCGFDSRSLIPGPGPVMYWKHPIDTSLLHPCSCLSLLLPLPLSKSNEEKVFRLG